MTQSKWLERKLLKGTNKWRRSFVNIDTGHYLHLDYKEGVPEPADVTLVTPNTEQLLRPTERLFAWFREEGMI